MEICREGIVAMIYKVLILKSVMKFLKKQNIDLRKKVLSVFKEISGNYKNIITKYDIRVMQGINNHYRLRIGKIRFLYELRGEELVIYFYKGGFKGDMHKK